MPTAAPEELVPEHRLLPIEQPDAGRAAVKARLAEDGHYHIWLQGTLNEGDPAVVTIRCDGTEVGKGRLGEDVWQWVEVGNGVELRAGEHEFVVTWAEGRAQVRALCVTNEVVE